MSIPRLPANCFEVLFGERRAAQIRAAVERSRALLRSRSVWHVSSSPMGDRVSEAVKTFLSYGRSVGIDTKWTNVGGDSRFRAIATRLRDALHKRNGGRNSLTESDQEHYANVIRQNAEQLRAVVQPRDVVVLHEVQTAGLVPMLRDLGAVVVWRCHAGHGDLAQGAASAWTFLKPYLDGAHALVFPRADAVPTSLEPCQVFVIPPSIDAFAVRNQPMSRAAVRAAVAFIGLTGKTAAERGPCFSRSSGSGGWIVRRARIIHEEPVPGPHVPLVAQVSLWDRSIDMLGVMRAFASQDDLDDAHLALVGPEVRDVRHRSEAADLLDACVAEWEGLPQSVRRRVHIVCLPVADAEENAVLINAVQRHATVIVEKALTEGFSVGVTEAMWKGRAIVASAVGGIRDQIVDGKHGLLLQDADHHGEFGRAVGALVRDRKVGRRLGRNARRRCVAEFLQPRETIQYLELFNALEPA